LYEAFRGFYGKPGATLVWKGTTEQMNPTFDQGTIEREIARDPEAGRSEWLAEWRSDLQSHIPRELVDRAMVPGGTRCRRGWGSPTRGTATHPAVGTTR
jgi:hypothetical protein